jgi:uncharacterized membrane protein
MALQNFLYLVLLTLVPVFELRWSIPVGLWNRPIELPFVGTVNGFGMTAWEVLPVVIITNILLGFFLFFALGFLVRLFTRIQFIKEVYERLVARTQRKARPSVEKYGPLGLALFIGIPLPGTGVWTGALAAYLLGMRFRGFAIACIFGVLIAASIVTAVTLGLMGGLPA